MRNTMIKAADDEMLEAVAGGDYFDDGRDNDVKPMYNVGDIVEVYDNFLHITTSRAKITTHNFLWQANGDSSHPFHADLVGSQYYCEFLDPECSDRNGWYTASDIER